MEKYKCLVIDLAVTFSLKLDVCKVSNPCKNGATCVPKNGGYTCNCKSGFHGVNCEHGKTFNKLRSNSKTPEGYLPSLEQTIIIKFPNYALGHK